MRMVGWSVLRWAHAPKLGHPAARKNLLASATPQVQNDCHFGVKNLHMGTSHHQRHHSTWRGMLNLHWLSLSALAIILFSAALAQAQKSPACNGCPALYAPPVTLPKFPDDRVVVSTGVPANGAGEHNLCSIQPFPGLAGVTTVDRLEIPAKARKEYRAACSALQSNQLAASEQHLRKAIQIYPKYVAGWVMLGQTLEAQQKPDLARSACSQASNADPKYVASYLCLAEIAGREEKWGEVLRQTTRALELDPAHDPYAYFFSAIAYFSLNQFAEAEQRALKAEELDREHHQPRVQYLLGQIYKARNDPVKAAAQLREYLKYAPAAPDSEIVKKDLAKLETGR
jgi:tetratricopeptide (TPR) repeat protein